MQKVSYYEGSRNKLVCDLQLLKKHMDHVEKSKLLMGADRMFELGGVSPRK